MTATSHAAAAASTYTDDGYEAFLGNVTAAFSGAVGPDRTPLFTTDADGLWELYLDGFNDPAVRQHHNCRACRHFIDRFGGLVTIDDAGRPIPVMWSLAGTPPLFRPSVYALVKAVRRATVTGVFLSSDTTWGTPKTGPWRHLAVRPPAAIRARSLTQTAGQMMAEKREDYRTVVRALNEFTRPHLETAVRLLRSETLYRSEKVLGQAEWLHALLYARASVRGAARANVVWHAVATAPAGFCHPRASMIGSLLEDIAAGKSYEDVSRAFAAKMNPTAYQRPQAAPRAGTITAAEKVVEQLGAAGSLARRWATLDDVQTVWRPGPPRRTGKTAAASTGVFADVKARNTPPAAREVRVPEQTMTWVKFERTVLPTAERIEFRAPSHGAYSAIITAVDPDAPPILQWDDEDARNPCSWYVYANGSSAASWSLTGGRYYDVPAVTLKPSMWAGDGRHEHQGKGVLFALAGARDLNSPGLCLFPEILKSELHGVRSVIEAHSRNHRMSSAGGPQVAGVMLTAGPSWNTQLRVYSGDQVAEYRLDRWD